MSGALRFDVVQNYVSCIWGKTNFSGVSNAFHSPGLTPPSMDSACFHKLAVLFEVYLAETNLVSKIYLAISGKH